MKRLALPLLTALAFAAGCTPNVEKSPPPSQVHARFDPSTSPPTVPSPNSLAIDPSTGKVMLPLGPNATDADRELAAYFATLDGFPASTPAQATFDGELKPESVTPDSVKVIDMTGGMQPVTDVVLSTPTPPPGTGGVLQITEPGGWKAGHDYAVVLVGGNNGLKGADGKPVVGTSVWALTRSQSPLVTCSDLTSPDCHSTTRLLSDQQAIRLEPLRRLYQPLFDAAGALGIPRNDIPLAWTFKIASATVMAFQPSASPPVVPTPTDLALDPSTGTLNIPVDPSTSPANQAFVRDYLNTLNGYPVSTPGSAPVAGGTLEAGSVSAATVRVLDLTPGDGGAPGGAVDTKVGYDPKANAITVQPPAGGWEKGHHYAVIVVGGPNGVKSSSGDPVEPSDVWVLARGTAPVASCADPANSSCNSNLTVVNLSDTDAARLEQLRQGLAPLLDAAAAQGLPREAIPIAWTFGIFSNPEAVFDPANEVIPFPNDLLRSAPTDGGAAHVELPVPDGGSPQIQQLIAGLNTLDGFSTTAPAVSENDPRGAPLSDGAQIDPASLDAGTGFVRIQPSSAPNVLQTEPHVVACLSCASSLLPDGGSQVDAGIPEQLQFVPQVPLDEQTTYAAFLTTSLRAQGGTNVVATPTFALIRSPEPLVDQNGKSTVSGVTDAQAKQLEPVRQGLKPVFDALESSGHPRRQLALAWAYTTQSTVSQLAQLAGLPAAAQLPDTPIALAPDTTATLGANESAIFNGEIASLFLLTGPGGTLNPTKPTPDRLPFVLVLPKNAPSGGGGYPVAIFAHGITSDRNTALLLADTLAQSGIATLAIDNVWHGERSSCTGSAAALKAAGVTGATDDFACGGPGADPKPVTQACDEKTPIGRCVSRAAPGKTCTFLSPTAATDGTGGDLYCASIGQGQCLATSGGSPGPSRCEGGDFWRPGVGAPPVISGWNVFDTQNLFATRDNFRQQVVDFAQLARVVKGSGANSLNDLLSKGGAPGTLDGNQIHFVGQSLGSILGSLYNAVSPDTHRVALNAPAGDLPRILLTTQSKTLVAARDAFLAGLSAQGLPPGTPGFDNFIGFAKWILDPADPVNAGAYLVQGSYIPSDRRTFIQYIEGDQTLSNPTTQELIAATIRPGQMTCANGGSPPCGDVFEFTDQQFGADMPAAESRHSFLLNGASPTVTGDAQSQIAQYLTQGSVKTTFP